MGVLTNFFVANADAAEAVATAEAPFEEYFNLKSHGLDATKLGSLYPITSFSPFTPSFMNDNAPILYESDSIILQLVPSELVVSLCQIPDMGLPSVAKQWAGADCFKGSDWTDETVEAALMNFTEVCREALGEGKAVMMYYSV